MNLSSPHADIFVPDETPLEQALSRTTHLAVAAHQDDTEIFAYHGISECFGRKDKWFSSVVVTDGAGSPRSGIYRNFSDAEMRGIRKNEQKKAALIGDYSVQIQLGYPSSSVKDRGNEEMVNDLAEIFSCASPEYVYLHNPADKHDTHVACTVKSIEALRRLSKDKTPERVFGCEVWRGLDWLCDDEKIPLPASDYGNIAAALLGVFDSQISGGKRYDLAVAGRRLANATFLSSHETDKHGALIYAVDLTPLVRKTELPISSFVLEAVERFKNDVKSRIEKLEH